MLIQGALDENPRNWIFDQVKRGRLTPRQGEAAARECRLTPLASDPPMPAFDPMKRYDWTIAMVTAWRATGDLLAVRRFDPGYCRERRVWSHWEDGTGWRLETRPPDLLAHMMGLEMAISFERAEAHRIAEAESRPVDLSATVAAEREYQAWRAADDDTWEALRAGTYSAIGLPENRATAPEPIPAVHWRGAHIEMLESGFLERVVGESGRGLWHRPTIARDAVLKEWPAGPDVKMSSDAGDWLRAEMRAAPLAAPHPKDWYLSEWKRRGGKSNRAFGFEWTTAIRETGATNWSKSGRRKS